MHSRKNTVLKRKSCIYVAGGETLAGAALLDLFQDLGYENVVGFPPEEPDLTVAGDVDRFFADAQPEFVFFTAGASGGIGANRLLPADFMRHNLLVQTHVLHSAFCHGVRKLLYLASSCCYPRHAPQPMRVESLLSGPLEPTSAAYATAKLAGLKLCQSYRSQYGVDFISAVPANVFGPHDDFHAESGHVIPGLMRRLHEAKCLDAPTCSVWGTGAARREFLYVRDLADACLFIMEQYDDPEPINLGGGTDLSIAELARMIAAVVGYAGRLRFDASMPDGMPFKGLESSRLGALGWMPATDLRSALAETYAWFLEHADLPLSVISG